MRPYWFLTAAIAVLFMIPSTGAQEPAAPNNNREWNTKAPWGATRRDAPLTAQTKEPFKVFDNVYSVGFQTVSSYLVTTSAGLVLIDTGWKETREDLLNHIRKMGFNPADIKYVLITHSHSDHYGGASRVKQVSGARVGMSLEDWQSFDKQKAKQNDDLPLSQDLLMKDGESLKVGDEEFKFYFSPGHTVGATSIEFQVRDRGKSYRALAPGGLGLQFGADATPVFLKSMIHLKELGPWDVIFGNHPFLMPKDLAVIEKELATRGNGPNPAIIGPAAADQWFDAVIKTVREKLASEQSAKAGN